MLISNTYPPLQEFQSTLVLGYFQQLHRTLFIWSMSCDFTDQVSHKFAVFGLFLRREIQDELIHTREKEYQVLFQRTSWTNVH